LEHIAYPVHRLCVDCLFKGFWQEQCMVDLIAAQLRYRPGKFLIATTGRYEKSVLLP
jgi:hypothetical protein